MTSDGPAAETRRGSTRRRSGTDDGGAGSSSEPWLGSHHTVEEAARRYRRHPRTIRDWIARGCPTPHGVVRLEACKLGKSWMISDEAILLFEHRVRPPRRRPDLAAESPVGP